MCGSNSFSGPSLRLSADKLIGFGGYLIHIPQGNTMEIHDGLLLLPMDSNYGSILAAREFDGSCSLKPS